MVSVIIPLFNSEKFIRETVDSILAQTYKDFELLLVDDYSTDKTERIVKEFPRQDSRVNLLGNNYEKGISGALNTALDYASGEFIAYLDHDDISLPTRLGKQVKLLSNNPEIGVCGSWMKEFGNDESIWKFPIEDNDIKALSIIHSPIANPTAMLRRSLLVNNEIRYKSEYDFAQDYQFWLQLIPLTKFANLPEVLVMYRVHKSNASSLYKERQYDSWKKAFATLVQDLGIKLNDAEYRLVYRMKYPSFFEQFHSQRQEVSLLIERILDANEINRTLPNNELIKLFAKKVNDWEEALIESDKASQFET